MPRLAIAREDQIDQIYRQSHGLWGAGLSLENYRGLWRDLSRTPWGSRHARFYVWSDEGERVLSSVKVYRPQLRLSGRTARVSVIGALFTPVDRRGRGHATEMIGAVIAQARRRGERAVLLFSDIGTAYYASFGFRPIHADEQWGGLPRTAPRSEPGWALRDVEDEDRHPILQAHHEFCMSRPMSMIRDADHWQFLWVRSGRYFERLEDPAVRHSCSVALRDGRFSGYLIAVEGRGEWNVREVGAVRGDPKLMATVLRLGAAGARRRGLRDFYGWLPREVLAHLEDWNLRTRPRRRAVPMFLFIDEAEDLTSLSSPRAAYLPFQDQF